jgi:Flp pilus assembly protein TadB
VTTHETHEDRSVPTSGVRSHRGRPVLVLILAVAVLTAGLVLPHGLMIAAGLVLAGVAGHLVDRKW